MEELERLKEEQREALKEKAAEHDAKRKELDEANRKVRGAARCCTVVSMPPATKYLLTCYRSFPCPWCWFSRQALVPAQRTQCAHVVDKLLLPPNRRLPYAPVNSKVRPPVLMANSRPRFSRSSYGSRSLAMAHTRAEQHNAAQPMLAIAMVLRSLQ